MGKRRYVQPPLHVSPSMFETLRKAILGGLRSTLARQSPVAPSVAVTSRPTLTLVRGWYFTREAEWLIWHRPATGQVESFQVVVKSPSVYLEWRGEHGFRAGLHDDGEKGGRHKATPVMALDGGLLPGALEKVRDLIEKLPVDCKVPVELRDFIRRQVNASTLKLNPGT